MRLHFFGQEDMSFVSHPDFYDIFYSILNTEHYSVSLYLRCKHYNVKYPQNHNIRGKISDGKDTIDVYTADGWVCISKREFCQKIVRQMETDFTMILATLASAEAMHGRVFDNDRKTKMKCRVNHWMKTIGVRLNIDLQHNLKCVKRIVENMT